LLVKLIQLWYMCIKIYVFNFNVTLLINRSQTEPYNTVDIMSCIICIFL